MSWSVTLPEIHPQWWVLSFSAVLLCSGISIFMAKKRLQRQTKRFMVVMLLNILASVALVGLIADIKFSSPQLSQAVLLTSGSLPLSEANQRLIDSLAGAKLYVMADALLSPIHKPAHTQSISSAAQLFDWQPQLQQLTIIGDGLPTSEWQYLQAERRQIRINFRHSDLQSGLVDMRWEQQLILGESMKISGALQVAMHDTNRADLYDLTLFDPMHNKLAQQTLRAGEKFEFALQARLIGNWLYQLQLGHHSSSNAQPKQQALASETLAVSVLPAPPVKLLIYQSAPSFETRQLRAWAGSFANPVTVVTQISKDKHLTQHFNHSPHTSNQIQQLNRDILREYDLVVMDGRALSTLSQTEWLVLKQSVKQGLGLLLLADSSLPTALTQKDSQLASHINLSKQAQVKLSQSVLPTWPNSHVEQALSAQPMVLSIKQGRNLIWDEQQQSLLGVLPIGLGNIAVSLINSSYQWQTSGKTTQYSAYWQYLFKHLAANRQSTVSLTSANEELLLVNQASTACILSTTNHPQVALVQANKQAPLTLKLSSAALQQDRYCTRYWSQQGGWQQLKLVDDENTQQNSAVVAIEQSHYVYGNHDWAAWQQQIKLRNTALHAALSESLPPPLAQAHSAALNKLWCWAILLLSCSLLWIERKTANN